MAKLSLTIQFIPYSEIESLTPTERIKKLLKIVLDNKIVLLQGKLKAEEEARLIEDTMVLIGNVKGFKGVELAVLAPKAGTSPIFSRMRKGIAKLLVGAQDVITIIGPATLVREIKKDPSKIELFLKGK
ncbi:DUF2073 domain-containing protein [Candidatus Pacearchaeota archaeon]|nr:DUF2073 domain-containing protein [Candidatus Pacearchaeota archaeon]